MNLRIQDTGEIVNQYIFRQMFPNVSFPTVIDDATAVLFGANVLYDTPPPIITPFQSVTSVYEQDPVDEKWKQMWTVVDITDPIELTVAQEREEKRIISQYINAVQNLLDTKAQENGYDDIKSAALRSAFDGPWHDEGVAYAQWMDGCWSMCYQIFADVKNNIRMQPTIDEVLAEMPILVLPNPVPFRT